jgi:hypothetical protein
MKNPMLLTSISKLVQVRGMHVQRPLGGHCITGIVLGMMD